MKVIFFLLFSFFSTFGLQAATTVTTAATNGEVREFLRLADPQITEKMRDPNSKVKAVGCLALIADWLNGREVLPATIQGTIARRQHYLAEIAVAICIGRGFDKGIDPTIALNRAQKEFYEHAIQEIGAHISAESRAIEPEHAHSIKASPAQIQKHLQKAATFLYLSRDPIAPLFVLDDELRDAIALSLGPPPIDESYTDLDVIRAEEIIEQAHKDIKDRVPNYNRLVHDISNLEQGTAASLGMTSVAYNQRLALLKQNENTLQKDHIQPSIKALDLINLLIKKLPGIRNREQAEKIITQGLPAIDKYTGEDSDAVLYSTGIMQRELEQTYDISDDEKLLSTEDLDLDQYRTQIQQGFLTQAQFQTKVDEFTQAKARVAQARILMEDARKAFPDRIFAEHKGKISKRKIMKILDDNGIL